MHAYAYHRLLFLLLIIFILPVLLYVNAIPSQGSILKDDQWDNIHLIPENTQVIDVQITSDNDDNTFYWNGSAWTDDGLGYSGLYVGYVDRKNFKEGIALRWAKVPVPPGAIVSNCYFSVNAINYAATTVNSRITGDKELEAATWTTIADYQSRRGTIVGGPDNSKITSAQVVWNDIEPWAGNQWYDSPDISAIVQEIVDQPGWGSGNPVALFWDDHEGLSTQSNRTCRGIDSYYYRPSTAAKLHIEYTLSSSQINPTLIVPLETIPAVEPVFTATPASTSVQVSPTASEARPLSTKSKAFSVPWLVAVPAVIIGLIIGILFIAISNRNNNNKIR